MIWRNALVRRINDAEGITKLGTYLLPFDALYTIWLDKVGLKGLATPLVPTALARAGTKVAKIVVKLASIGAVEWVGEASELLGQAKSLGWEAGGALDVSRENLVEDIYERTVRNVQSFIHKIVTPRLSSRLSKAIGEREVLSAEVSLMMYEMLATAVADIQADLASSSSLLLFFDAIDEADDETVDTVNIRFTLASIAADSCRHQVASIMGGRAPSDRWRKLLGSRSLVEHLAEIPEGDIKRRFRMVGIEDADLQAVISAAGSPNGITAGSLSEACKRLNIRFSENDKAKPRG